ncbi:MULTISPECIES: chloramphenicol phosphotransferase CPT [unclassified Streptomyces]|uniref:chloramphenicol phosphotransferase CPT n=1 Tax=unclassified Streptomyces TaxID=2593676 RepID=UPI0037FBA259
MAPRVIVLNGGSSSGKSGIARCLQALLLPDTWLTFGVDTLIEGMPAALRASDSGLGIAFGTDGEVTIGPGFRALDEAWARGIGEMARAGARVVVDEVFLGGASSQDRWRRALDGLDVLWVGVRCAPEVAAGRETARGDRVPGMAVAQAGLVHRGVIYDLEVDTTHTESIDCARTIAGRVVPL